MSSARKFEQVSAMIFKEESVNFLQEITVSNILKDQKKLKTRELKNFWIKQVISKHTNNPSKSVP